VDIAIDFPRAGIDFAASLTTDASIASLAGLTPTYVSATFVTPTDAGTIHQHIRWDMLASRTWRHGIIASERHEES